jgi:hypothetical protein
MHRNHVHHKGGKKAIPVTGHEGPKGFKTSRLPYFLDNRLTDGGEVSLTRRPPLTPQEDSWYSFPLEAESTPRHSAAGRIRWSEKSHDFIGIRTRDLPACSVVPQRTTLPRALNHIHYASAILMFYISTP